NQRSNAKRVVAPLWERSGDGSRARAGLTPWVISTSPRWGFAHGTSGNSAGLLDHCAQLPIEPGPRGPVPSPVRFGGWALSLLGRFRVGAGSYAPLQSTPIRGGASAMAEGGQREGR